MLCSLNEDLKKGQTIRVTIENNYPVLSFGLALALALACYGSMLQYAAVCYSML